ncbi:MAG: helix-turn-helix transcriptional regulator [Acidimicrobiia bacterium]|jgi:DNA-binding PadR family transcriptional regulator
MRGRRPSTQTATVLSAFLESPGEWFYGYDLSKRLGLPSGTLYPILMRLEDRSHLETRWTEPTDGGRPPRHMYRLTTAGRAWAAAAVAEPSGAIAFPRPVGDAG